MRYIILSRRRRIWRYIHRNDCEAQYFQTVNKRLENLQKMNSRNTVKNITSDIKYVHGYNENWTRSKIQKTHAGWDANIFRGDR